MRMPDPGIVPATQPTGGTTSRPLDSIGATGSAPHNSTVPRQFGFPMDSREYPSVGFSRPMGGPGTPPSDTMPINKFAVMGQSTTIAAGFGNQTPSGTGLRDQPDVPLGSRGSGTIRLPENYHPQVSSASPVSGRKRVFK